MSKRHPIIAVTGSSGAGTTTTGEIFSRLFASEGLRAAMVSGDSFHRYNREQGENVLADEGRRLFLRGVLRELRLARVPCALLHFLFFSPREKNSRPLTPLFWTTFKETPQEWQPC